MNTKSIPTSPARRARVLCADDEASITTLLQRFLMLKGYEVDVASDGQAALTALQTHPEGFDVVISDHNMPGLTGLELVQRARTAGNGVPFIIVSGAMRAELVECYADLGVTRHISKPVSLSILLCSVELLLNESANL